MGAKGFFRCPVCRAGFRGTRECTRCGADLTALLILSAKAGLCREKARKAIRANDFESAHALARHAQRIHATEQGRQLLLLTSWLKVDGD